MKKSNFRGLAAVVAVMGILAACGDNGDTGGGGSWGNPPSTLVGTWKSTALSAELVINANGTGTNAGDPVDSWKVKGTELKMTYQGIESIVKWSVSGTTLTLDYPSDQNLVGMGTLLITYSPLTKQGGTGGPGNGGGDAKPENLSNSATHSQAVAKLDAIIAYSETPAATKQQAQELKNAMTTPGFEITWVSTAPTYITMINNMIDTIPDSNLLPPVGIVVPIDITVTCQEPLIVISGTSLEDLRRSITVSVDWSNGRNEVTTDYELTSYSDIYAAGKHEITVQFWELSTTFTVTVVLGAQVEP